MATKATTAPKRAARKAASSAKAEAAQRITVENVNTPGRTTQLDAAMYAAMRRAMLKVLPTKEPGLTQDEMRRAVVAHLPNDLFPAGAKAGWWAKAVQLDLEAKGVLARETSKPLRWHRTTHK
jgi:hypothetical protein